MVIFYMFEIYINNAILKINVVQGIYYIFFADLDTRFFLVVQACIFKLLNNFLEAIQYSSPDELLNNQLEIIAQANTDHM